jgi:hypothetical protein
MPNDFIEITDSTLDPATCAALISRFERSGQATRGRTGGGLDVDLKDSWDICIDSHAEWRDVVNLLNTAMMRALIGYVRKYPFTALAPLALRMQDPASGQPTLLDLPAVAAMSDELLQMLLVKVFRPGTINLQKYIADQGGYPYWHSEQYPKEGDGSADALHRQLLWSVYLNDSFEAGETEFYHQQRLITPKTGAMLIAPAGFTHTHRGNRPRGGHKYIATSWVLFQRSEVLFGGQPAR